MKKNAFSSFLPLVLLFSSCSENGGSGNYVEGLSYLDHKPLRIEIADGKIIKIMNIKRLSDPDSKIYIRNFSLLAEAMNDPELLGSIPGFHLEGPFISPVDGFRGAHPLKYVRKPDWEEFMEVYEDSGKNILQVTLA